MATPGTLFDPDAVAVDVRAALDQHRAAVGATLAAPATTPMFTRESDGTLVDRAGRVLALPVKP